MSGDVTVNIAVYGHRDGDVLKEEIGTCTDEIECRPYGQLKG